MVEIKSGWQVKGIYNETCASEGPCPYYFGRDKEGGCRYFMVFRITEGKVNDVDLTGITVIYVGDIPHPTYEELDKDGSEGGIYVSDDVTEEQRKILDKLVVTNIGAIVMKKVFGVKYVNMKIKEEENTVHFKMPFGEMKMELTKGLDGTPARFENLLFGKQTPPILSDIKACNTNFWKYTDYGRHFDYKNRCGVWANFMYKG